MQALEEIIKEAGEVRDKTLALIKKHEQEKHGGEPCRPNRASMLGYLAHCLGMSGQAAMIQIAMSAVDYDTRCIDKGCKHDVAKLVVVRCADCNAPIMEGESCVAQVLSVFVGEPIAYCMACGGKRMDAQAGNDNPDLSLAKPVVLPRTAEGDSPMERKPNR